MPRHCPDCKAEMQDDQVNAWCVALGCTFRGYVVVKTGKILRYPELDVDPDDDDDEPEHDCGEDTCCCAGQYR